MRFGWACFLGLALAPAGLHAADPSALWKIVNSKCVPHEEAERDPSPCSDVDIAQGVKAGFAVLKDIKGISQFLLIPTERISGIEDPAIRAPDAANYWNAAWQARYFVEERLHMPLLRDGVALAINSAVGRSQDQLHIHIDCIRPDVREALAANLAKISGTWTEFPVPLAGHSYRAIRIDQETLDGVNPFQILADANPGVAADMGMHTLVLVGEIFSAGDSGFVLLDDHADLPAGDHASGEQLEDHTCAVAEK